MVRSIICCGVLMMAVSVCAAPPDVKWVFPAGGQIGQKVTAKVSGKLNQPETDVWCSRSDLSITIPESGEEVTIESSPESPPGLCWLRFFNPEGATGQIPFMLGRLPEVIEVEPNNEPAKAQAIEQSSVINAKLAERGDVDIYSFALKKGQTLVASVDANWRLGFPVDPVMQLLTSNGTVVEQNDDDRGFDPLLAFTAPQDGTWLLRVFGFPATPNSSIQFAGGADYLYRLTLTTEPYGNHIMPLAIQQTEGETVQIAGWSLPDNLAKPVRVNDVLASSPDSEGYSIIELPGALPLNIVDHQVTLANEPCSLQQPVSIEIPATLCGVIDEPGDEDSFRFRASKGDVLTISVRSREFGFPLDPHISVLDADGKVLSESDDASREQFDSLLTFAAKTDGEYTLRIRDLFENGGWRFAWQMRIYPRVPSIDVTLKADVFKATLGTDLEIPVTLTRRDGFNEEVMVSIDGLPDGASAESVKSEAKGTTAKSVKLLLKTENAEPFNGPIRIVGRYGEASSVSATVPLTTLHRSTDDVWLTILPAKEKADSGTEDAK